MFRSGEAVVLGTAVPSLTHWGRSPDADLLYRTLVTFGPNTAAELTRDLGMSRQRVTAALDELASVGAVVAGPRTTRRGETWAARPVAEVISALRGRRLRLVVDADRQLRERHALTQRLVEFAGPLDIGEGLRHLRTRALTRARLSELTTVTGHEHLTMNPEQAFDAESARPGVSMDRTLLARGVQVRVLGVQPASAPDPMLQYGREPSEDSPEYREAPVVPMKLFLLDRKIALFPVHPSDLSRGYLEVAQPPVVAALVALFEKHWEASRDPEEYSVSQITLDPRERALIRLLAQGHTDATAARELRISPRSVSNILRSLMDRLGVDNRFQLGLALGASHVIPAPARSEPPDPEEPR